MIQVTVIRNGGGLVGTPVVDKLISTTSVALARGETILGDNAHVKQRVVIEAVFRSGLRLGSIVEVQDATQTNIWRGKVVGINHSATSGTITTLLTVDR